ncbi:MAG: penicillin-binding protein 2 [Candidatus Magasanikbacteria bacterium CG11_big_fil_rev_8_21_14_0_20_39_34]|uniref:Penicillin-binding protein 2 n=1 Tax=Candidatus Magasanikbacteria bacterium CG11_big_fil_rev_8_21_14_0_20_39_34 TaxID=1974653 RepID=A0A2H0N5G2_9BACT|nr:MAG: penicillin-binding protein 2 [Candidatus Magasanikbacteria bacterium CG11_big_fil_rev_8_21_14_0_20_39_34]
MDQGKKNLFGLEIDNENFPKLFGRYRLNWVEDSFNFEKGTHKQIPVVFSGEHVGKSFLFSGHRVFFGFICIVFSLLLIRLFYLQIVHGEDMRVLAEGNRQRTLPIQAERGLIFDRNGVQLTENIPSFALVILPQDLPQNKEEKKLVLKKLSKISGISYEDIDATIQEYSLYSYESIVILDDMDYEEALKVRIASAELPGVQVQSGSKRFYTYPTSSAHSLAHILGYEGKISQKELSGDADHTGLHEVGYLPSDLIGKTGVEQEYENLLRGMYGKKVIEIDATGHERLSLSETPPQPGQHIQLSIDLNMQNALERIIQEHMQIERKTKASGIVMDPSSGQILAMVSLPSYDNNDFSGGISQEKYQGYISNPDNPLFNRSISGTYPSGSVIKTVIGASALQEGIITPNTTFLSTGGIQVNKWFFPDWKAGGHGRVNLRLALANSVNTFFYIIGGGYSDFVGLGVEKIASYLSQFGFSKKTGIDLPSEATGFLPSKEWKEEKKGEVWYIGDTYNLSIGQGDLLVTPLQICNATASIVNGGKLFQPTIFSSLISPTTSEAILPHTPTFEKVPVSVANLNHVKLGMRDCVLLGSCRRLSTLPFSVGAKTGTAQWNNTKENHAWFTSFAPYDSPKIVVTILIEEGGEGSQIAAPIAYDFYAWWWNYQKNSGS